MSWQKIDERTGAAVEDEDITDSGSDNTGDDTPAGGGGTNPGDNEGD